MLAERIHNTLRFFDLQNFPLTAWEIRKFLIADLKSLRPKLGDDFELLIDPTADAPAVTPVIATPVHLDTILAQLRVLKNEKTIAEKNGFYCLAGREEIIANRQKGYLWGIKRERFITRYAWLTRYIPFVRSVALLGSQAMGQQKPQSDIDLFVITDSRFMGIARFFLTLYFQVLGLRRHGSKIANRFCLNHYVAGPVALAQDRNLYTAEEYLKARMLVYGSSYELFLQNNSWVYTFFPNARSDTTRPDATRPDTRTTQSKLQAALERLLSNSFGAWLENRLISAQLKRIEKGDFIISSRQEMSFHPENRKKALFAQLFNPTDV